jgi:hypothetical protein
MFWKRTTTTTDGTLVQTPSQIQPAVQIAPEPVSSIAAGGVSNVPAYYNSSVQSSAPLPAPVASVAVAPTYNRPYEPIVAVPVTSVASAGVANVATADRTFQPDVRRSYNLVRIGEFIWLVAGVLEALFAIRVILKVMAANSAAGFDQFITNVTAPFLAPFTGLMTNGTSANGSVLEVTTLIAMMVYALLAWGIVRMMWIVFERRIAR